MIPWQHLQVYITAILENVIPDKEIFFPACYELTFFGPDGASSMMLTV